ncbi:MAG: MarR family winged helix-turn-helix transcriptional regulator [Desulfurococcaceae archaeon]
MSKSLSKHDLAILKFLCRVSQPVYQNDLPKLTNMDLKVVTKTLYKLEKIGLVQREPAVHHKRRTYLVKVDRDKVTKVLEELGESILSVQELFTQIADLPCITCQNIFRCYEGGFYDPLFCQLLANYIVLLSSEPHRSNRKRANR